jgi:Tfp pilus assembly protein PilO
VTTTLDSPAVTAVRPDWGMYADLTPPELLRSRRLHGLRRTLLLALLALLAVIALVFAGSIWRSHQAAGVLAEQQTQTSRLQADQQRYAQVTQVQDSTRAIRSQLAGLGGGDVDVPALLGAVRTALPRSAALGELGVTLSGAGGAGAAAVAPQSGADGSLDTSGNPVIGNVTMSGTSSRLADLAAYVAALQRTRGFVDIVPVTNQGTGSAFTFTVTASVTDRVLSHRFDPQASRSTR